MLALLLFQGVGIPLRSHWCGGTLASVEWVGGGHGCCASAKTASPTVAPRGAACHSRLDAGPDERAEAPGCDRANDSCRDDLHWEVRNAAAAGEVPDIAAAPSPRTPPNVLAQALPCPSAAELAAASPRGPPPPPYAPHSPRGQRLARLQVYRI